MTALLKRFVLLSALACFALPAQIGLTQAPSDPPVGPDDTEVAPPMPGDEQPPADNSNLNDFEISGYGVNDVDDCVWAILHGSLHVLISETLGIPASIATSIVWEYIEHTYLLPGLDPQEAIDDILFWDRLGDLPLPVHIKLTLIITIALSTCEEGAGN